MAQFYSNPARETDPHALPDAETFQMQYGHCVECGGLVLECDSHSPTVPCECGASARMTHTGWFYWFCFPGCLPDSDANGPFDTEGAAIADAREQADGSEEN